MRLGALISFVFVLIFVLFPHTAKAYDPAYAIVVDHTCVDITAIPQSAIEQAKENLHIAYGHTSHGSQLITGMNGLIGFANNGGLGLSLPTDIFAWSHGGDPNELDLHDGAMGGDVGYYPQWVDNTLTYLGPPDANTGRGQTHPETNVIIWSWCGQASSRTEQTMIDTYLAPMSQLEANYPNIAFVYMTGHLDGTGETGNLNLRNQQIRDYCIANNKILYDFADIESYDPDQLVNYMPLLCNDNCAYDSDDNGSLDRNWALDWQGSHTEGVDWFNCTPAHSQALNGNQKGYAAWWLWAHLGGWNTSPCLPAPSGLTADANLVTQEIVLNWTDNSHDPNNEDYFIVHRSVDGGAWDSNYAVVSADVTTFTDTSLAYGTYRYRVSARDLGECDSQPSNIATGVITSQLPAAPSALASVISSADSIDLSWTDNSDNEETFVLERAVDANAFEVLDDTIGADTESYQDSGLAMYHTYTYRIKAHNGYGDSDYSNETSEYVAPSVPDAPSGLGSTIIGTTISLSWTDNSNNEDNFVLEREIDSNGFDVLDDAIPANTTTYQDSDTELYHTYTYRVFARNGTGDSAYSNETSQYLAGSTTTITLQSTSEVEDSFLLESNPTTNYGSTAYLSGPIDNYIVKFNFPPELTAARIVNAEIAFYGWQQVNWQADQFMDLYRVTHDWVEMTTTWNIADTDDPWTTPGGDAAELLGQVELIQGDHIYYPSVDVTDIVQKWVNGTADNYGMLLVNDSLTGTNLKASEYGSAHTYLEITYTVGCPCIIASDINYDCTVDGHDYAILAGNWQTETVMGDTAPAPTGDGFVDMDDLATFCDEWLTECP
ncbi:MAG: DNRLRE domain-containing protein [Sedimentisphaerales bacterium]|nr:DNRLRE domain-containing protein [Sedimentisphaerales bacterium]